MSSTSRIQDPSRMIEWLNYWWKCGPSSSKGSVKVAEKWNPPKDAHLIQLQLCSSPLCPEHVDEDLVIRLQKRPSLLWCPGATCTYVNIYIVFVFDKAWLSKKSGNKTPFGFRLSRPTLLSTWETPAHRCWTSIPTPTCCLSPRAAPEWNRVQPLSRDWF